MVQMVLADQPLPEEVSTVAGDVEMFDAEEGGTTTSQHGFSALWEFFSIIVVKKCNLHTIIHFLHPGKSCRVIYMYICTPPTFTRNPSGNWRCVIQHTPTKLNIHQQSLT